MAQTRYGDLRDTFYLSRLTNNGLLRHADFSASCWKVLFTRDHIRGVLGTSEVGVVVPTGFEPVFKP